LKSKIVDDDFYIYFGRKYKDKDVITVIKLKNGIEFEYRNNEPYAIIIPQLIKQLPTQDFDEISIDNLEMADDDTMHLSLDVDGTIISVQFDCAELRKRNI